MRLEAESLIADKGDVVFCGIELDQVSDSAGPPMVRFDEIRRGPVVSV